MAWVEDEPWEMEQGKDASLEFRLWEDDAATTPWLFSGWQLKATVSDQRGRVVYPATIESSPANGIVRLILPKEIVNILKPSRPYRYDVLMVAPGVGTADDHFLAAGPVTVALRTSREES